MKNFLVLVFGMFCSMALAQIPTDGLVAHYPFNGNANDESGNGYNGEVFGATLTADRFGNANGAYSFDGVQSKILVPNYNVIGNSERSYFAWIKSSSVIGKSVLGIGGSSIDAGEFNLVVGYGPGSSNYPGKLGVMGGNFTTGGHDYYPSNGPSLNDDVWHFIGVTFDGVNQLRLFVDGELVNAASMVYNTFELQNHIGYNNHNGSQWDGSIDDVLLYNRALSAQEIVTLFQNQSTNQTLLTCSIVPSSSVLCSGESAQLTVSTNQVNSSNGWTQLGNLDVPIHAGAGAIYNGKIIMAAGGDQVSNQLLVRTFDLSSLQSATINAPIPQITAEPGFGFYNQKLFVIGGYNGNATNFNQSFDVNSESWSMNATMPTSRSVLSSAQIDHFIYVLGGWPEEQPAFERYNVLTNTWEVLPNIPTPRHSVNTAAAINGKVYFFAGKNAWLTTYFNKNEMYDPVTNVWVEKSPTPFANYGASACAHNGKIYVLGGATGTYQESANGTHSLSNKLWIYTPETDSWVEGSSFPKYIHLAQLLSDGNDLYCVGGICSDTPTGTKYTSSAVYKMGTSNTSQYAWSTNETTPTITVTPTANTTYSCTVTQGNQTCTASVDIEVNPAITNTISATIIEGETYTLGTQTLTTAGTYTEVFTSAAACDSTVTLTLGVEPLLTCNITPPATTLCEGESVTLSVNTTSGSGTSSQLPANLQEGLMAYYPLDGVIQDLSNSAFGGQNFGATPTSDRYDNGNGAYEFNGNGSYIEIDDIDLSENSTISFWVFPFLPAAGNNNWNYSASIIDKNTEIVGNDSYGVYYNNLASDDRGFYAQVGYTGVLGNSIISGVDIPLNQWNHCVWTKDGNVSKLFLNGDLIYETFNLNSMKSNNQSVLLGKAPWGGNFFSGKLDDLLFYNRTLSPSEIQQLYIAQSYAWSNNATTPTITVTPTQTTSYIATVTTATQTCTDSITITVNPLLTWYADADEDGFGNPDDVVQDCNQPQGYIANNTDCNDEDAVTYPGAAEICDNNRDENCDGADSLCFVAILGCTDVNACNFNPEANTDDNSCILPQPETCNGLDDNCNRQVDEGFTTPSINATSATPALYPTCTGNALKSANLLTGTDSPVIAGSGPDLWYSFTAQYNTLRVGLSAAFGDNSIGLYTNNNGCLELISEEHEVYTATTVATGNQILLTDQLTVGQTYYVAVHQITGPANASAKVCFTYLNESSCDHYYSNNTGIYTNVCNSFKAQYRANATNYLFNVLSGTQNGVNMNLTPWTYTNNNSNSVVARLGSILPANHSGVSRVYTLSVPTVYGLTDAAGNVSSLVANATSTCTVTLNSENTIALRSSDRCPTNKSLTSTIAPDRTVCGAMRYDWEFTEVLPNPGTAQVVQGGNYTTVFFLSNLPGITAGKTYSVRVRPVHSSGIAGQWGSVQCLRVGAVGMVNHPGSADAEPPLLSLRAGGEMNSSYAIYPNPTSTGSFVLQYNGPRRGELTFALDATTGLTSAQESMTELVMLDITGNVVFRTNVILNGDIAEIHFGDLESGLYLVDFGGERIRIQVLR